jgi:ketosteroid isomerase-like protein
MTNAQLVRDILRHSDRGDSAGFRACLADDCEWVNPVVKATGADEIARNVFGFFAAFPHRDHQLSLVVESGDIVAIEGHWVATHESGLSVDAPFAAILQARAGLIVAVRLYLDTASLMAQLEPAPAATMAEDHERNKALYRRWFTDVVSRGDMAAAQELLAADYRLHFPGMPGPVDRDGHLRLVAMFRSGFPDWVETVEDVVAEDDRVVARVVGRGTHLGKFQGVRPTGRQVSATGIGIGRVVGGQIVESWAAYDALGLLEQLQAPDQAIA